MAQALAGQHPDLLNALQVGLSAFCVEALGAIRGEIHDLAEKVGEAATREELDGYVTREAFEVHVEGHKRVIEGWRGWLPIALASVAILWNVAGGPHLVLVMPR